MSRHPARPRADTDENLTQRRKDAKQVCKYASLQVAGGLCNVTCHLHTLFLLRPWRLGVRYLFS